MTGTSLAGTSFTLSDTVAGFTATGISPSVINPASGLIVSPEETTATLTITGTGFTPSTTVKLVGGEDGFRPQRSLPKAPFSSTAPRSGRHLTTSR